MPIAFAKKQQISLGFRVAGDTNSIRPITYGVGHERAVIICYKLVGVGWKRAFDTKHKEYLWHRTCFRRCFCLLRENWSQYEPIPKSRKRKNRRTLNSQNIVTVLQRDWGMHNAFRAHVRVGCNSMWVMSCKILLIFRFMKENIITPFCIPLYSVFDSVPHQLLHSLTLQLILSHIKQQHSYNSKYRKLFFSTKHPLLFFLAKSVLPFSILLFFDPLYWIDSSSAGKVTRYTFLNRL